MRAKIGTVLVTALLALFAVLAVWSAISFIRTGTVISVSIGIAVLLVVVICVLLIIRELVFGMQVEKMARILHVEGGLPEDNLPRSPAGRIDRAAADAEFEQYRSEAEAAHDDWRSWFRLSLAYDASGDRRRARAAMRDAIRLKNETGTA